MYLAGLKINNVAIKLLDIVQRNDQVILNSVPSN